MSDAIDPLALLKAQFPHLNEEQLAAIRAIVAPQPPAPETRQQIDAGESSTINDPLQISAGGDVRDNLLLRDITIAEGGTLIIGALPVNLPPRPEAIQQALCSYLETLHNRYCFLSLQGLGAGSAQPLRIALRSVFVSLRTDQRIVALTHPQGDARAEPQAMRATLTQLLQDADGRAWLEELATPEELALIQAAPDNKQAREQHGQLADLLRRLQAPRTAVELIRHTPALVLLGDPGSGKTTVLRHLALGFALARLEAGAPEAAPLDAELAWRGALPLPILIQLRRLADELRGPPADAGPLLAHLERTLSGDRHEALAQHLVTRLETGSVLILCDGLDEVPDDLRRAWAAQAVALFQSRFPRSRIVLTSRTYAYRGVCELPPPFLVARLQGLEPEAQDDFIERWYRAALLGGEHAPAEQTVAAASKARDLVQALARRPRLREIGANPLLLTMMALVHLHRVRLPQGRAALYEECLHLLLEQWEQRRADGPAGLTATLDIPEQTNRLALLQPIAYQLHLLGREEARQAELRDWLLPRFLDLQPDRDAAKALIGRFLSFLEGRSGLLLARDIQDRYAFPHRTLQEYLVARELIHQGMSAATAEILRRRHDTAWREVILLVAGHLVVSGLPHEARELGWKLFKEDRAGSSEWYRSAALTGEIAEELETAPGPEGQAFRVEVVRRLVQLVEGGHLPAKERVEAAFVLGRLGDPRLPAPEQPDYWCDSTVESVWDDDETEEESQQLNLPHIYQIGRFPVTNVEYRQFVKAGGYDPDQPWWTEHGRAWIRQKERTQPGLWHDPQYNAPNQPVVAVSWYEAVAYCDWLTRCGHTAGWLSPDTVIRLPSYPERIWSAHGRDKLRYPWGNAAPDPERANYQDTGIGRPSPVGCFPAGRAPCGALDLAGNVMEWTTTKMKEHEDLELVSYLPHKRPMLLAGGVFHRTSDHLCGSTHYGYSAGLWDMFLGFRVARSPEPLF
ncbi:MAG TPA: SUMF1/EgtB/PvdO family nonheme iron enzyme [Roseiflexaceae bacterium]|nr:SUMF1/EgtB/PvdO family nonheme iron enzyme [Roseiflexaceae bacterium]